MTASIIYCFILAFLLITTIIATALPVKTGLNSIELAPNICMISLYKAHATSEDLMLVPNNGTLFDPNPSASPIERVCIGSDTLSCAFGAEDGTWIAAYNSTDHSCVDISPPLVLNNGFCCVNLDHFFLLVRDGSLPTHVTVVEVFGSSSEASLPSYVPVENNGNQLAFNPAAALLERVCMLSMSTMSCVFRAEDGTLVQIYNETNSACSEVSPPRALSSVACCIDANDCPSLHSLLALRAGDTAKAVEPEPYTTNSTTTLTLTSIDNSFQYMTVPTNGTIFSFSSTNTQVFQVCVNKDSVGCTFQAADGTAYAAYTFRSSGCVSLDPTKSLDHGFCCEDFHSCGALNLPNNFQEMENDSQSLRTRGAVVNDTLAILYEGSPNLVGWEVVLTNLQGFNVTDRVPWAVGQICLMSETALCAFVGEDGTDIVVIGGQNGNCAVVGPPQILIDGCCCNSYTQCNASEKDTIARIAGPTVIASILGTNAADTSDAASNTTLALREISVDEDITVQYWGAGDAYAFQLVDGGYHLFTPAATWGVDQVCIITPQGFCGFWNNDYSLGFEVGPVAAGQSGACYTVGGAYVLDGGICCRSSDSCNSKRSVEPFYIRDNAASDSLAVTYHITFYHDPAFSNTDGKITTVLHVTGNGDMSPIIAFGQPVVKVCVDSGGSCQFWEGDSIGPSIFGSEGGCLDFDPSINLTAVACD